MRNAPVLIAWYDASAASPSAPLRFLEAPGLAILRQNVAGLRTEHNPLPTQLQRIARAQPRATLALFGPELLAGALRSCQQLAAWNCRPIAVRGRLLTADSRSDFAGISFEDGLLPLLEALGVSLPRRWVLPVVLAEAYHPRVTGLRFGALFSRPPEPGVLDVRDLFEHGRREGAPAARLDSDVTIDEARDLLGYYLKTGVRSALVVDLGGDAESLAEFAHQRGMLGGWMSAAASPLPEVVARARCPVWTWFEPDDGLDQPISREPIADGVAWVPIGLSDEGLPEATARLLHLRRLGYSAIVPRFHVPCPNTREWQNYETSFGLRDARLDRLAGTDIVFDLPHWKPVDGAEVLELLRRGNRWPDPPRGAGFMRRSVSFESMRQTLDEYLTDTVARVPDCHARDVVASVLNALGPDAADLELIEEYPFVALSGRNLLDLVQDAIAARLLSLGDLPSELLAAICHAALVGGKRIRPVLTLVMTCAWHVPIDAAMPAALAIEWLHTASLIQDDLPCMDDDDVRRRDVSTHRRYGEGMALLASDALIAIAFEDIVSLGFHAAVGVHRAGRMAAELARTLGVHGLVGGQAQDLLTRRLAHVTLHDVLEVHRRKTVPLFRTTAALATILADVEEPMASGLVDMLASLGLAFQVVDDVLDATPQNGEFGRAAGSDERNKLPTFATLMDTAAGRRYARKLMEPHLSLVDGHRRLFGLQQLSTYVLERRQ